MMSWEFRCGQGAEGTARRAGPWPERRITQVKLLRLGESSEERRVMASKEDLAPPRTRIFLCSGEDKRLNLEARSL